jgi:type VI secretion system protein ImpC
MVENNQSNESNLNTETQISLLDEIIESTNTSPDDEGYEQTKHGLELFISYIINDNNNKDLKVNKDIIDLMISEIDFKLQKQLDVILHNKDFQKIESTWRSLNFLVSRTDFRENIKIEMLNVTKEQLLEDFENSLDNTQSGLYKHVYTKEYGQFGGEPYGLIIGNYDFGPKTQDIMTLKNIAKVATVSHAPFISAASAKFFGMDTFSSLPDVKDLNALIDTPQLAKWRDFRASDDARNIALTLPRFLLRSPYGEEKTIKSFDYHEDSSNNDEDYVWGNAAFSFASNVINSFAKYRWCSNIIGPKGGGEVSDLPEHAYSSMGSTEYKIPTEILLSERKEFELSEEGFIGLTMRKGSGNASFFSANSIQKAKSFGNTTEGKEATSNYKLGTQLPYMFIINRLAHYVKVIQRENIGTWKSRNELEKELNEWIKNYISDQENPSQAVRQRRPLRSAQISVFDVESDPGWYRVSLKVVPHFKYMGSSFTLSLVSKLDKK